MLLLLLRLLIRLRSAEGEREPRCLYPPSLETTWPLVPPVRSCSPFFLLIAVTPWMCYVPPRPHLHKLNKPAGFGSPPAATPLLPLLVPALHCSPLLHMFPPHLAVSVLFSDLIQVYPRCSDVLFNVKMKAKKKNTTASPPARLSGSPLKGWERSGDRAAGVRLVLHDARRAGVRQ